MQTTPIFAEIAKLEQEIFALTSRLGALRKEAPLVPVLNYTFTDQEGSPTLSDLFAGKDILFAIHNMGQGCRYCTLWADGLNGFLPHLEDKFAVVLLSKDPPEVQRRMANARGWRFRTASHGGGKYIEEQTTIPGEANAPGLVCYVKQNDGIFRRNATAFGPGDSFCAIWHVIALAGRSDTDWIPQYQYWKRPAEMDDGGAGME